MAAGSIIMNTFRQDAFSGLTLTDQVNRMPFLPSQLGDLGIFEDQPIMTTAAEVDRKDGLLQLILSSPRGAPLQQRTTEKRQARYFEVPRLAEETTIYAQELQNVRSESTEMMMKDLAEEVAIRISGPTGIVNQIELTMEYHRLGAIQGILLDADGSTLYNWYNEFTITPPSAPSWALAAKTAQTLIPLCNNVVRTMRRAAKGAFTNQTEVHALCGDSFFDAFTNHPDVIQTYQNWAANVSAVSMGQGAPEIRLNRAFGTFWFGGIYFHNYRGTDDNSTVAIPLTACKFFPVKAPGVFKRYLAPGEGFNEVNQRGKPRYMYRDIDPSEEQTWVKFKAKSFPLHICTRPEVLAAATI